MIFGDKLLSLTHCPRGSRARVGTVGRLGEKLCFVSTLTLNRVYNVRSIRLAYIPHPIIFLQRPAACVSKTAVLHNASLKWFHPENRDILLDAGCERLATQYMHRSEVTRSTPQH